MKFSVSSYSYQQAIRAGVMTQEDAVYRAAEMGFSGIEFTDLSAPTWEEQLSMAKRIRRMAANLGLEVVAYAIGASLYQGTPEADAREVERVCRQVDVAAALGAPVLRHDVCYSERVDGRMIGFARMLPTIAENARKITAYAKGPGIRTCSENHGYVAQDADRMEALFAAVNDENYGLLIDIGNFACVDADSVSAVSRLAPYAVHVHAKDFCIYPYGTATDKKGISSRACNTLVGCVIGEGDLPVRQSLAVLRRAGYDGYVTVEYEGTEDCMTAIPRALDNLKVFLQ